MKNNIKKLKNTVLSSTIAAIISSPLAFADDIEIYTGTKDKDSVINIQFLLDTSGSMDYNVSGTNETRMEQAKAALKAVINDLPGDMRVGLSRFNSPGGSILTPSQELDTIIEQKITLQPSGDDSDAYEKDQNTEDTVVFSNTLEFGSSTGTESKSFVIKQTKQENDAIECVDGGTFKITSSYSSIPFLRVNNWWSCVAYNGFIFEDIPIEQGTVIKDARIKLSTAYRTDNVESETKVQIENTASPKKYRDNWGERLRGRSYRSESKLWDMDVSNNNSTPMSPNLRDMVQNVVNKSSWDEHDNGLSFRLESDPYYWNYYSRIAYFHTADSASSNQYPELHIDVEGKSPISSNIIGVKFDDLQIPSNGDITEGNLKLIASSNNGSGTLKIRIENNLSPEDYKEEKNNISDRQKGATELSYHYSNWNSGQERFFDVSGLIQDLVDGSNWCGGKDINFLITSDSSGGVYSKDRGETYSPELSLRYGGGDNQSCLSHDKIVQVENHHDDADENTKNGKVFATESKLTARKNGGLMGVIFRDINIPSDATIKESYVQITTTSGNKSNKTYNVKLHVVQPDTYPIPAYVSKNGSRDLSEGRGYWYTGKSWQITDVVKDKVYSSPDISSEVTSIIRTSDYQKSSEKSLEVIIENYTNENFKIDSYDGNPSKAAKLVVRYEGDSGTKTLSIAGSKKNSKSKMSITNESPLTVRQYLLGLIDQQPTNGGTPMEGSLYEVGQYFMGEEVNYGRSRNYNTGTGSNSSSAASDARVSSSDTYINGDVVYPNGCSSDNLSDSDCRNIYISGNPTYITPMTNEVCETNNIILITDGEPNGYSNYSSVQKDYHGVPLATLIKNETKTYCNDAWSCIYDWAEYTNNADFMPNKPGRSNIFTHVIGFNNLANASKLQTLANHGGGTFVTANNTDQLVDSLNLVISSIMQIESTMATPGVAVNQNNRTEHLSDIYYSVFQPAITKAWSGNLKKYQISTELKTIVDKYDQPAVNEETGFFEEDTTSFWSTEPDGGEVELGGAANMQSLNRKVLTYTGSGTPKNIYLDTSSHRVESSNGKLTKSLFGLTNADMTNTEFAQFVDWLGGKDVFDENLNGQYDDARKIMGDPLHSRPILLSYGDKDVIYVSTNEGFLHAINAKTGAEEFSFIPQELLGNSPTIYAGGSGDHIYGLDGSWVAWRKDKNKDGLIKKEDGDFVYIYSGMRRGGDTFYALDVTVPNKPILKFIKTPSSSGMDSLGQTWSEPVLAKIKLDGVERAVIILTGGYDLSYDNPEYKDLYDNNGNSVYLLDAYNGDLIYKINDGSSSEDLNIKGMNYAITSKPAVIDFDSDGYIDTMYLTDLASQIIKIKFNNKNTGKRDLATGKIIAKLGKSATGDTSKTETRMMFDSVAVAPIRQDGQKFFAIVAGTGYRSHPLNEDKQDVLVVIRDQEDYYVEGFQKTITSPIVFNNLYNATNDMDSSNAKMEIGKKDGYYIKLQESDGSYIGEKMTGTPLIYDNQVYLTTYVPNEDTSDCVPVIGYSRGYQFDLMSGTQELDTNGDGIVDSKDRYEDKMTTGIANGSQIIYTDDGNYLLTNTDLKSVSEGGSMGMNKKRWYIEKEKVSK